MEANGVDLGRQVELLRRELDEALEQQRATSEILRVISTSPGDVGPVFDAIAESAARLCRAEMCFVVRFDGAMIHPVAYHGMSRSGIDAVRALYPRRLDRGTVAGRAVLSGATEQVPDVYADPEYQVLSIAKAASYRSAIGVPLMRDGKPIGSIAVARQQLGLFPPRQVELLRTFADHAVLAIENVRLFEEAEARNREMTAALEQQTATSEVLRVISTSPGDVGPVFDAVAENAARLCGAEYCFVFRFDGELLHRVSYHGVSQTGFDAVNSLYPRKPDSGSAAGRAVVSGAVEQIPDVLADPDYQAVSIAQALSYRSAIAVPLMRNGTPIGSISVARQEVGPFPEQQVSLLQTFADQAVLAMENARLFEEAKARNRDVTEALEQQTATSEVLRVISTSPGDVGPVFDAIAESAARLCEAEYCFVFRFDGELIHPVAYHGVSRSGIDAVRAIFPRKPDGGSAAGRAVVSGATEQIADVYADPEYQVLSIAKVVSYRSAIGVPLMRDGKPIGSIAVTRQQAGQFPPRQVELLQTFAEQAVLAIENVRLFTDLEARNLELKESLQQQTATSDVLKVISRSTFDLQAVLETLVESGVRLCEAHDAAILLRDGETLQVMAHQGPIPVDFPRWPVSRDWVTGRAVVDRVPVHVADLTAMQDEFPDGQMMAVRMGHRTMMAVPLLRQEEAIGALIMRRTEVRPFTGKQIELVQTFADQAVIAIENVRLFEEVQAGARELEKALQQQTATADVLKVISRSAFDLQTVLDTLVQSAARLCVADKGGIVRLLDGRWRYMATHGYPTDFLAYREANPLPDGRGSAVGRVVETLGIVHIEDVLADPEYATSAAAKLFGFRAVLAVPLLRENDLIGVFVMTRAEPRAFSDQEINLVTTFADQAAIAIENVRLFEEVRAKTRDLEEALTFQKGTAGVLEAIGRSASSLQPVLDAIAETAADLCRAELAAVRLLEDGALRHAAASGKDGGALAAYSRRHPAVAMDRSTVAGRVALEGRTVHIHNIAADAEYRFLDGFGETSPVGSALGVPLLLDGNAVGAIVLMRKTVDPFTERQIALVQTFADQAVIAMQNVRLFQEVQARTEDLARSLEELRTAQDRLIQTEKLASLGQLTTGIAHEIKNPLNFVNNFAALSIELMSELRQAVAAAAPEGARREAIDELAAMLEGNLDKIVQHGRRADSIVRNMLLHSRQGSGEHRPADINAIVEESLNLAWHGARAEKQGFNVTLEKSLDPAAGEVDLYPQEITRVLLNLIANGFHATISRAASEPGNGYEARLAASTRNLGDSVEIVIRDNGTGIPPEVRERMFDPFFTTKPAGEGTGLGLSISHDIVVKQHAGSIEVDTEPGGYTEFRIRLPRNAATAAKPAGRP